MIRYRFELTPEGAPTTIGEFLEGWLATPELRALVEEAGGDWPASGPLSERLERLQAFSDRWDFRAGGERLEIAAATLDEKNRAVIQAAATALGLDSAPAPATERYEHALVLGGTLLACLCRTRRVRELIDQGVHFRRVVSLGALRPVQEAERAIVTQRPELAVLLAEADTTEFDGLVAAATAYLAPAGPDELVVSSHESPHLAEARARLAGPAGLAVEVIAAPSGDPSRRANTADNLRAYTTSIADGDTLLCVTSSVYLPYQAFTILDTLGWERTYTLELTGFPPAWMGAVLTGPRNVLQETRSAFTAAHRLAVRLDQAA